MKLINEIFFYALLIACFDLKNLVSCEKCTLRNSNHSSKNKLLDSISLLTGIKFLTAQNGFSYAVSICSDVSKNHPKASVTRTVIDKKNTTTVLGRYNETDIVDLGDHQILLTYSAGDNLQENSSCDNTKWKTLILISCDYKADDINIDLLDALNDGCFALFRLKTSVFCPIKKSPFFSWLIIILVIASVYFVCGILYKRYSEGAKGWEQVPHYEFWRNPLQHLMGCLKGKDDMSMPRNQLNDSADEPLLPP